MAAVRSITLLPLLCGPVALHFAAVNGVYKPLIVCGVVWLLLVIVSLPVRWFVSALWALLGLVVLTGALFVPGLGQQLLPVPPLLVFIGLALIFGLTLRPGQRPLVTRIAAALGDPLDTSLSSYTRQVTIAWVGFFAFLAILSLVLWLVGSRELWSLFTNFIAYALILLMFVAEYGIRRRRFSFVRERSFVEFMCALTRIKPSELLR